MADESLSFDVEANTSNAQRAIQQFIGAVSNLNTATGHADKNLQKMERTGVQLAAQMAKYAGETDKATQAIKRQETAQASLNKRFEDQLRIVTQTTQVSKSGGVRSTNQQNVFDAGSRGGSGRDPLSGAFVSRAQTTNMGRFFGDQQKAIDDTAAKQAKLTAETQRTEQAYAGLANTRYAMYDVARSLTVVSAATLGVSVAAIKTAADFESMFVQVQRTSQTSGAMWDQLRTDLMRLNSELPATVEEITSIATLGGQMGIAAENIDNFTESVVKFTASTNVTADAGAEKLARVAQLAGVAGNEYDDLVASIYQASVTSVSTADDILSLTQQIAVSANQAGFAAEQTVALASALASLGVAPERARGSIQRSFNIITNSVDNATGELQTLARVSGMSADEFSRAWKDDAQGALLAFLEGLGRAGEAGQNMNNILSEVGINAVRDSDALRRLAQNTDVYTRAIQEANEGWNDGQVFQEGYAMTAETLDNMLLRLGQTLRTIIDSLQNNEPLKWFVSVLQDMADAILYITTNVPFADWFATAAIAVGGLVGVLALAGAGVATAAAGMMAMIYVVRQLATTMGGNVGITNLFKDSLLQLAAAKNASAVAAHNARVAETGLGATKQAVTIETLRATAATKGHSAALHQAGVAAQVAAVKTKAFRTALISTGVGLALVAFGAAVVGITKLLDSSNEATEEMKESLSGLGDAVKEDTKLWKETGEAIAVHRTQLEENTSEVDNSAASTAVWVGAQEDAEDAATKTTGAIENQTIALGENSAAAIRSALANSEAIQELAADPEARAALERTGFSWDEAIAAGMKGSGAVKDYSDSLIDGLAGTLDPGELNAILPVLNTVFEALDGIGGTVDGLLAVGEATAFVGGEFEESEEQVLGATEAMQEYLESIFAVVDARGAFVGAMDDLGASLHENGNNFSEYTEGGRANLDALKKAFATAIADTDGDAEALGVAVESIIAGMEGVGITGVRNLEVVRDMVTAVAADIAAAAAAAGVAVHAARRDSIKSARDNTLNNPNLSGYARSYALQEADKAIAREERAIEGVKRTAEEAVGALRANANLSSQVTHGYNGAKVAADEAAKASERNGRAAKNAGDRAKKAAQEAQKEIRTVSDYVSDLSKVMNNAFNFRFGFQQAEDGTRQAFRAIQESMDSAEKSARDLRTSMQDLRATMQGLRSERTILDYQLRVAREYNDTIREQALLAEIAKNEADQVKTRDDLADQTKELAKEERFLQKNLSGTTGESEQHREMVLGLVKAYQDQITEYANTGASQKQIEQYSQQLRGEFARQLTQLGYNQVELKKYTAAFDDMSQIIRAIPRDVTTKFNAKMSAADRALMEHFNGLKNKSVTANQRINNTTTNTVRNVDGTTAREKVKLSLWAQIEGLRGELARRNVNHTGRSAMESELRNLTRRYQNYWEGGYVGNGGKKEPMGVVHGGEFVFTKEATRAIGPANLQAQMEAAQRGTPYIPGMMVQSGPSASMPGAIALTAGTIQQIAAAVQNTFYLNGQQVANAANQGNRYDSSVGAA